MFTTTRRLPTACVAIDLNTDDCLVTQLIQRCMIFPPLHRFVAHIDTGYNVGFWEIKFHITPKLPVTVLFDLF